ncbi:MAG: sulfatase [Actinomycetota bacterium]
MRRALPRAALCLVLVFAVACSGAAGSDLPTPADPPAPTSAPPTTAAPAPSVPRPKNIVVILTDDQRWDTLWAMPRVQQDLIEPGVVFENAYVVNPVCCPSRASILTGLYSKHTGVYTNGRPDGGVWAFDPRRTIATSLQHAGYRTALVGKYLNGYEGTAVPPGWDRWFAFAGGDFGANYVDYVVNDDGRLRNFGSAKPEYSLDVLTGQAVRLIRQTRKPLFLYLAVSAPHSPAIPAPRYASGFVSGLEPNRPPSFNEADVSDKPRWLRRLDPLHELPDGSVPRSDDRQAQHMATLLSVDEMVGTVIDTLAEQGELEETMIVFASDNGLQSGEHRLTSKYVPYEESIRIPLVVRFDPAMQAGVRNRDLALNIDIAPTIAAAAGVRRTDHDGRSLLPLLRNKDVAWRDDFLVEHAREGTGPPVPSYCAIHGERWVYVRYATEEEELYDLQTDPYQLANLSESKGVRGRLEDMRRQLRGACRPTPPGFPASALP